MAKLFFYYSTMNAGKSTSLLQASYNHSEHEMKTICLLPYDQERVCGMEVIVDVREKMALISCLPTSMQDAEMFV